MTTLHLDSIPQALKDLPQWVVWRREMRDGKPTKVPYNAITGNRASVTNPADWGTFEQATEALARGQFDGIGFVLTKDDPITGVDLDHCLDPLTGIIEPWALAIVDQVHSYTEISPSNTGLRIFVRGKLPPGRRKKGPIEFYDAERYLTVTGNHLAGTPLTIEDRHDVLQLVHAAHFPRPSHNGSGNGNWIVEPVDLTDEVLLQRMLGSKSGDKIRKLLDGDWSDHPSQSEADSALCFQLAFYCGRDSERMDRLFRRSGLMRVKWDSPRGESTYGRNCIANACVHCEQVYHAPRTVDEVLEALPKVSTDELKRTWMTYVVGLTAEDRQTVLKEIARLTGIGVNTLKKALREDREQAKQKAAAGRIGDRCVIDYYCEDICATADQVEAAVLKRLTDGECARFGDSLVRVCTQTLPHTHQADSDLPAVPTAQFDLLTQPKLLPLIERAVVLQVFTAFGATPISVPPKVLDQILVNPQYVPTVSGLSGHPLVTRPGRIIAAPGIDPSTRLLLYGTEIEGLRAYTQTEGIDGIEKITDLLLEGFEFATPLDRAAALALLLTAVERKLMDMSPGFLITAAQQSLGKTTLARLLHCIVTGTDAPIFTCPDDDDVEVQKLLLSTLLRSPEIVVFDNVGDGLTFRSPALSAAMTSATKQGRLLGHNRDAVVSTSVVFILTGNNVELANDEASRIIPIRLTTKAVSPHKRTFKHPDIVRRGLEIRETILRHVIGLIAGYQTTSERVEAVPSRFPQWDALVRHPLLWAGLADVGTVFDANIEASPELGAHLALMIELQKLYPEGKEFSASSLVRILDPSLRDPDPIIKEALLALRVKDLRSERSIGHCLSRVLGRNAVITQDVVLYLDRTTKNGLSRYRVLMREREGGS